MRQRRRLTPLVTATYHRKDDVKRFFFSKNMACLYVKFRWSMIRKNVRNNKKKQRRSFTKFFISFSFISFSTKMKNATIFDHNQGFRLAGGWEGISPTKNGKYVRLSAKISNTFCQTCWNLIVDSNRNLTVSRF